MKDFKTTLLIGGTILGGLTLGQTSLAAEIHTNTIDEVKKEMKVQKAGETHQYKVQKGDTLSVISEASQLSMNQVMAQNKIVNPDQLEVGQRLTLNPNVTYQPAPVYTVQQPSAPMNNTNTQTNNQDYVSQPQTQPVSNAGYNTMNNNVTSTNQPVQPSQPGQTQPSQTQPSQPTQAPEETGPYAGRHGMNYNDEYYDPYPESEYLIQWVDSPSNFEDEEDWDIYGAPFPYQKEYDEWLKWGNDNRHEWMEQYQVRAETAFMDYTPKDGWTQYEEGGKTWEDWRSSHPNEVNQWLKDNQDKLPKK